MVDILLKNLVEEDNSEITTQITMNMDAPPKVKYRTKQFGNDIIVKWGENRWQWVELNLDEWEVVELLNKIQKILKQFKYHSVKQEAIVVEN